MEACCTLDEMEVVEFPVAVQGAGMSGKMQQRDVGHGCEDLHAHGSMVARRGLCSSHSLDVLVLLMIVSIGHMR